MQELAHACVMSELDCGQQNKIFEALVKPLRSFCTVQITTYKVHKVEYGIDSAQSSLDERASRAMSGLSMSGGRNVANPMADAVGLEVDKRAFAEVAAKAFAFASATDPARLEPGGNELTLDFTETGCVLSESASFSSQVCTFRSPLLYVSSADTSTRSFITFGSGRCTCIWTHQQPSRA